MARDVARRLPFGLRAGIFLAVAAAAGGGAPACYSGGGGQAPPDNTFYFPVGLAVSGGGHVLYAVNSDFDLQWNGGTLQSYDLSAIRGDTAMLIQANFATSDLGADAATAGESNKWLSASTRPATFSPWEPGCLVTPPPDSGAASTVLFNTNGSRVPVGEACAPPVVSTPYNKGSAVIGAFATDVQIEPVAATRPNPTRLFIRGRGDATVTWADVPFDDPNNASPGPGIYVIGCGQTGDNAPCDAAHHTGSTVTPADTRQVTLPGEPFGIALTEDGSAIAITQQTSTQTSLLLSGFSPAFSSVPLASMTPVDASFTTGPWRCLPTRAPMRAPTRARTAPPQSMAPEGAQAKKVRSSSTTATVLPPPQAPSMQFVLDGVPNGGDGIVAVPHDPDGPVPPCPPGAAPFPQRCVRPAFLETNHSTPEVDLLRYWDDDGSSLVRPYLVREASFALTVNQTGVDSRGIVADPSPRIECKLRAGGRPPRRPRRADALRRDAGSYLLRQQVAAVARRRPDRPAFPQRRRELRA